MKTRRQKWREKALLCAVGFLPVIWIALRIAPYLPEGLMGILDGLANVFSPPFTIQIVEETKKSVGFFLLAYFLAVAWVLSDPRNFRHDGEYGSARWASPREISRKLQSKNPDKNLLLSLNLRMGTDNVFYHNRALIQAIIGDPGSGKSRGFILPNIMQMLGSYIILDPSGELLANTGGMLKEHGYKIRVLNLKEPEKSDQFNPFAYVHSSLEVLDLAEILWKSTTDPKAQKGEQFWDEMAKGLFIALAEYLFEVAIPSEQNLPMIAEMVDAAIVDESNPAKVSPLDIAFAQLEQRNPDSFAVKKYLEFKSGAAKTIKSIKISLLSHMGRIRVPVVKQLLEADGMFLDRVCEEKTAIFCVTPVADTSLNFVVSMLYQVLFNTLYAIGDDRAAHTGSARLPVPVYFLMDEFANVTVPADFQNRLGTLRKYGIGCTMVLQAVNQLKALYEKDWESILGMCSAIVYLGGSEQSTHEYISKSLDKETIDMRNYSYSRGRSAGTSEQNQRTGRELMMPGEVRKLPRKQAIVLVQGEDPVMDKKYDLTRHHRYKEIASGGAPAYIYDNLSERVCEMRFEPLTRAEKNRAIVPEPVPFKWALPEDEEKIAEGE